MKNDIKPVLNDIAKRFLVAIDYRFGDLFSRLNPTLWEKVKHNPVKYLKYYEGKNIYVDDYKSDISEILNLYENLINNIKPAKGKTIAYFSPEFGFHESLPNYAGGLGILAGDVIKTAALNGSKMIGVGLFYHKGYFHQYIDKKFNQRAFYRNLEIEDSPLSAFKDIHGNDLIFDIKLNSINLKIKIFKLTILNSMVLLLSSNLPENGEYANITDVLYTGDRKLRLLQEIILGVGGAKALEIINAKADIFHINEGHAAFALLERIRINAINNNISFENSSLQLLDKNTFTTHTPVIHGNEEFETNLLEEYFSDYIKDLGMNFETFISYGQTDSIDKLKFSMTVLGLNLSQKSFGVSKLHGETAAKMWSNIYANNKNIKPMNYVTNGIHFDSWIAPEFKNINIKNEIDLQGLLDKKLTVKNRMYNEILALMKNNNLYDYNKIKESFEQDSNTFTIGFARRFAKYKRADLMLYNINKLKEIICDNNKPVKILISGKAHPKDVDGKRLVKDLITKIWQNNLENNIIFLPDYDIRIGRLLVQGCDLWLNTPVKPLEASGTSGMKAALNFGVNFSISDGWWDEAYNGKNGFTIDDDENLESVSNNLYNILKNDIIPHYYDSICQKNTKWSDFMYNSHLTVVNHFSSDRMLEQYNSKMYK
jgi:starch phosphorylase